MPQALDALERNGYFLRTHSPEALPLPLEEKLSVLSTPQLRNLLTQGRILPKKEAAALPRWVSDA